MPQHIEVVGAVFLRDGTVLAARRGRDKALPDKWEFPGGKIEPGESPEDALARELAEELLIDARVGSHIATTSYPYDFGVVNLATFYCDIVSGKPTPTEHSEVRWVPVDELHSLDWAPADLPAVEAIAQEHSGHA
ncbi:(deoxy)nucleoside triphosphate pyrophosphohydrolase [Corynebacterium sp. UBA2622]|uniref:(deoxy)nucleoside triphosphate pyrophosphohydrolase n=1 Tax=Corynebacterium sp. UBA2622 TaxID=1946393 RepID=UPI0025C53AA2|nr:(deoxy)nucleoside triphosphate pyrophosphohydrolase [Corynebacterium sp. UBA2622]